MKILLKSTLILGALFGFLSLTSAQPCVRILTPTDDAYTNSTAARSNTNYGGRDRLKSGIWTWQGVQGTEASYLNFDLTAIPANATIHQASLELFRDPNSNNYRNATGSNAATIRNITSAWSEGTITANNIPNIGATAIAIPGSSDRGPSNVQVNVIDLVRQMILSNPSRCGMQITPDATTTYRMQEWASKEHAQANVRPRLLIRYTVPFTATAPSISVNRTCSGGSATINPPQGMNGLQYQWYTNSNGTGLIATERTITVTGTRQLWGRYSAVGQCGDRKRSPLVAVTITPLPKPTTPQITADNSKLCVGESIQLSANVPNGVWSLVNTNTPHTTSSTGLFTAGDQRGFFDVRYTVTNAHGCSSSATYKVTIGAIDFEIIAPEIVCPNTNWLPSDVYVQESFEDPATLANAYHWRISIGDNNSNIQTPTSTPKGIKLNSGNVPANNFIELSALGKFKCLSGFETTLEKKKKIYFHPKPKAPKITIGETNMSLNAIAGYSYDWKFVPFNLQTGSSNGSQQLGLGTSKGVPTDVPGWAQVSYTSDKGCKSTTSKWLPPVDHDHTPCDEALKRSSSFSRPSSSLEVFPNPASDHISFYTSGSNGVASVFSTSGVLVSSADVQEGDFDHSFDVSNLTPGLYVLQLVSNGAVTETTFVVE